MNIISRAGLPAAMLSLAIFAATPAAADGNHGRSAGGPMGMTSSGQGMTPMMDMPMMIQRMHRMYGPMMANPHGGSGKMGFGGGLMGPGLMGPGLMGQGAMGMGARLMRTEDLSTEDVKHALEHRLEMQGNKRLKVGPIKQEDDDTFLADIVTVDDSLVWRLKVDRHTGQMTTVE